MGAILAGAPAAVPLAACALVVASVLAVTLQDVPFFVRNVPDDGFYYLVVARNLAEGRGPTFDGITRTNGFHPMLAFLLAAIYRWTPASHLGDIRIAVVLGGLCHLLTGWLLILVLRAGGFRRHAGWAGFFYWLNPYAFLRSFGAMESPIYALGLAGLLVLVMRFPPLPDRSGSGVRPAIVLGLAAGAVWLARTDAVILAALLGGWLLLRRRGSWRPALRTAILFGLTAGVVVLPWIGYSLVQFGTVSQHSALMKTQARWQTLAALSPAGAIGEIIENAWVWVRKSILTVPLLKYVPIAILLTGWPRGAGRRWARAIPPGVWIYLAFAGILGLAYAVSFDLIRGWYLVPSSILMSFLAVHALRCFSPARFAWRSGLWRRVLIGLVLAESLLYPTLKLHRGIHREQADTYAMVEWAGRNLAPQERVGAFNAGLPAFFLRNPVVNLDGLMNNDMLEIVRNRTLGIYLEDKRVRYILDHEDMVGRVRDLAGPEWVAEHLRESFSLPGELKGRRLVVWEVM
jgi:hypothetical protein